LFSCLKNSYCCFSIQNTQLISMSSWCARIKMWMDAHWFVGEKVSVSSNPCLRRMPTAKTLQ
jgi:hypothetical protein